MDMSKWNPMHEDYINRRFNSYREGVGQDLQSRDVSEAGGTRGVHKQVVLYVNNIPLDMDEIALQNVFEQEGSVVRVCIPTPSPEKAAQFRSKIAFVTMDNARGAQAAIENLNGFQVKGRSLVVKVKQSREEIVRRKDQKERENEFYRSIGLKHEDTPTGASSGVPEPLGAYRSAGPSGDAGSISNLSMTSKRDMKVHGYGRGKGLLPLPGSQGPTVASQCPSVIFNSHVPTIAGSNVGTDLCANCNNVASLRCKGCRKVYYCNASCQQNDWSNHRKICTYDKKVPTVYQECLSQEPLEPDFNNLDVDVDEDFVTTNEEHLKDWMHTSGILVSSSSSSSSGDRRDKTKPKKQQQPGNKEQQSLGTARDRSEPVWERKQRGRVRRVQSPSMQQEGNLPFDTSRRAKPQGLEGRPQERFDWGPGWEMSQGRGGPTWDRADQQRKEFFLHGPGNLPLQGPGQFHPRSSGSWNEAQQPRNTSQHNSRGYFLRNDQLNQNSGGQFRRGPQEERRFQPRNSPQDLSNRNGPYVERGDAETQLVKGEPCFNESREIWRSQQWDRGGHQHLDRRYQHNQRGERRDQRGDGFGGRQNRGGPQQEGHERNRGDPSSSGQYGGSQRKFSDQREASGKVSNCFDRQQRRRKENRGSTTITTTTTNQQETPALNGFCSDTSSQSGADVKAMDEVSSKTPPLAAKSAANTPVVASTETMETSSVDLQAPAVPQEMYDNPMDIVQPNVPVTVVVSNFENPQCFWVHLADQLHTFVPLITDVFQKYTELQPVKAAEVGQLFLCKFVGEIARAKVVSVHGSVVKIFYIDYGNSEEVELSQLHPVPKELLSVPSLCFPCQLMVKSREQDGQWSAEVCQLLKAEYKESCTLTVLTKQPTMCQVTLVRCEDGMDAATFLKEKGFAVDLTTESPAPAVQTARPMVRDMSHVSHQLVVGQRVDVMMLEFSNPLTIFVHLSDREHTFNVFSADLFTFYSQLPHAPYQPVVGEVVMGRFSADNCWYRAEVLEVFPEINEASLFYVDFGNREQRPFDELRALRAEHASVPIHGVTCAMQSLQDTTGNEWREDQLMVFITCLRKYLTEGEMPMCTMLIESLHDGKVWVDVVSQDLGTILSKDMAHMLGSVSCTEVLSPADHTPTPTTTTEKATAPRRPTIQQLDRAVIPVGQKQAVGIQEIESCHRFYVNKKESAQDLECLRAELVEICEVGSRPLEACQSVSVGDVVLVKYSEDDQWYRGQVERIFNDGQSCTVFFLDYGNKEDKDVSSLREVPSELLRLPAQAVMCTLTGIPFPASKELERNFRNHCLLTEAVVRVVSREGDFHNVEVFASNGEPIIDLLGLGPPCAVDMVEKSQEVSAQAASAHSQSLLPLEAPSQSLPPLEALEDAHDLSPNMALVNGIKVVDTTSDNLKTTAFAAASSHQSDDLESRQSGLLTRECLPVAAEDAHSMKMIVMHVVSPSQFYAMQTTHCLSQNDEGGLLPQLQELCAKCPPQNRLPAVGEILSGLFEGVWYRCEVLQVTGSQVKVSFFDYGNEALLELSDLRPLPRHLCYNYPMSTIQCCMDGVTPASGDSWDEESIAVSKGMMENQQVRLTVSGVNQQGVHRATVTRITNNFGIMTEEDVAQALIRLGKAVASTSTHLEALNDAEQLRRQIAQLQAVLAVKEAK